MADLALEDLSSKNLDGSVNVVVVVVVGGVVVVCVGLMHGGVIVSGTWNSVSSFLVIL